MEKQEWKGKVLYKDKGKIKSVRAYRLHKVVRSWQLSQTMIKQGRFYAILSIVSYISHDSH